MLNFFNRNRFVFFARIIAVIFTHNFASIFACVINLLHVFFCLQKPMQKSMYFLIKGYITIEK